MVYVDDFQIFSLFIISVPFVLWGMWAFSNWFMSMIKTRRGFYSVRWIEQNHQEIEKMIKPDKAGQMKIAGKPRPFQNDPAHFILRGSKKIIEFTKLGNNFMQLSFMPAGGKDKDAPPADLFDEMLLEMEQFGKMMSLRPAGWKDILLMVAAGAAVLALIIGVVGYQAITGLPDATAIQVSNSTAITGLPSAVFEKITPLFLGGGGLPVNASVIP